MDRRTTFAVVAATVCLVLAHDAKCGAAARPLKRNRPPGGLADTATTPETVIDGAAARSPSHRPEGGGLVDTTTTTTAPSETAMDVSASASSPVGAAWERGDEALGAGKWLPLPMASALTSGLHFPGVIPAAGVSMPWIAGAPPALAGPGLPLMPPYVGATRQEQLSLWASLFNPFQVRPRLPTAETSVPAESRAPVVAGGSLERTTMDEPSGSAAQVGEPKWGVFLGTPNNNRK